MSRDSESAEPSKDEYSDEDWISASDTIRLVRTSTLSSTANVAIAKRAHAGLIRTRAKLVLINDEMRHQDAELPTRFWWAEGHAALTQNWELGDFETSIGREIVIQAFGVRFHRDDVRDMVPSAFGDRAPAAPPSKAAGRRMSPLWPDWVAELAVIVHEEGISDGEGATGSEDLIARVADGLAKRGLEGPTRTTVQEAAKAVLLRLRDAGNRTR